MKIVWRCETTEHGMLVEGSCIVGTGMGAKKFGSIETLPSLDFTAEQLQTILNQITDDIADMAKEYT
jgi:hypothetical protein